MEKKEGQGVTFRRRFRNASPCQKWLRHGVSGNHGNGTEDLGKALFKPTVVGAPEIHESVVDNRGVSDFCERYGGFHQTARKLTVGAPRQEKTDTLKPSSENTGDKEAPCPENTTGEETASPGNTTGRHVPCHESTTEEEVSDPENLNKKEMSCLENITEKGMSSTENMTENGPESVVLKDSLSTSSVPPADDTLQGKASMKLALTVDAIYQDISPAGKSEGESKAYESTLKSDLDNKLLEELEALPIPDHLKNQIRDSACATEPDIANTLLKDFLAFWSSVNEMISLAAKSAQPNVSDEMKEKTRVFLVKLFSARAEEDNTESCLTDPWAEEKKKIAEESQSLMENVCGTDQPMDKRNAIDVALFLSQQNKLTNITLTQIYSCLLQEQQPPSLEDRAACSKELKSLLSFMEQEESLLWKSLKDGSLSKHPMPGKKSELEGGQDSERSSSLKGSLTNPWHMGELSVEGEQGRSPVEDSFYFSTFSTPCITCPYLSQTADISRVRGRGTDLRVILSLIQKFVMQVGSCSTKKGQTIHSLGDKQTDADHQMDNQKDLNGCTEKDMDPQSDKQKDGDLEEKDMSKAAGQRQTNITDTEPEEIHEKFETEEKEPKIPWVTALEGDSEITEKSEYEESEKGKKGQSAAVEPSPATEPLAPTHRNNSATTDRNRQTSPAELKRKAGTSRPARTQQPAQKTEQTKKKKKTHQGNGCKMQKKKKKNQKSTPEKKRGHQPERGYKTTKTREIRWQSVTGMAEEKRTCSSTKRMSWDASQLEQQEAPAAAERVSEEQAGPKRLDEGLPPSSVEPLLGFSDYKTVSRDKQGSVTSSPRPEEAGECHVPNNHGKKSGESPQRMERCPTKSVKSLPISGDILKTQNHHQEESWCDPVQLLKPPCSGKDVEVELPVEQDWLDVQGEVVRARRAGDSPHGTSQGHGNGDSTNSTGSGGGGGSQSWGGARPKTTRNSGGGGSGGGGSGGDGDDRRPPKRKVPDSLPLSTDPSGQKVAPRRNYKRHRKKQHGAISNEQLCHCLGQAGQGMDTLQQSSGAGELNRCMRLCLHNTRSVTSPTGDDLACCTCVILHSLLSHFFMAAHGEACDMCRQLFTLVHFHILDCQASWTNEDEEEEEDERVEESARNVCRRMRTARMFAPGGAVTVTAEKMWTKVRKYLSAALGPVLLFDMGIEIEATALISVNEEESVPLASVGDVAPSGEPGRKPHEKDPVCLPEHQAPADLPGGHGAVMPKTKLSRRPSHKVVPQKTIPEEPGSPYPSPTPPEYPAQGEGPDQGAAAADVPQSSLLNTFPRQAETPEDEDDFMKYIRNFDKRQKEQQKTAASRNVADDPYATQKTYGMRGTVSMPEPGDRFIRGEQTLSVEMHPVGTPGIGEVVYGTRHQLQLVVRNWSQERDRCKASKICQYQHREEGVILHTFRRQLKILHTRYQKHHQWERLVHLGNGVTGKCHLCIDRSSNFKFCCKKVHILHYDDQELDIWSELDHPNIVRFYGAIRHGEKIYMFAEFIDGGSLAALIKEQWQVGRRLSHWTSLNYFRQLLQVLTYLQTKGVLHEDIKADNLLLRDGTTEIVLADFGAAQQIPHDHTPPNRFPVGSPAHWSPEKAASEGHGFSSDLWASACVLIHMLSGSPPWIARFPDAAILNYIIWSKPPPLDDLPTDVKESVRDLLACCLVKDKAIRPKAIQILSHHAFKLLDQASSFFSIAQHAMVASSAVSHVAAASVTMAPLAAPQPVQAAPQPVQAAPQPVQPALQPHQAAPQPRQAAPQPHQAAPQPPGAAPQPRQAAPQPPQAAPQPRQAAPQPPQAAPQPRRAAPQPRQAAPQPRQAAPQPVVAVLQPAQEAPPCRQMASLSMQESSQEPVPPSHLQRETLQTGSGIHHAGSPSFSAPNPSSSSPKDRRTPFSPQLSVLRVVEIPRHTSAPQRRAEERSGPQSLPATSSPSRSQDSSEGQPPVHRKSDPAISAPFSTGGDGNSETGPAPSPRRKMGRVMLHLPNLETNGGDGVGGGDISGQRRTMGMPGPRTGQSMGPPLEKERGPQRREFEGNLPRQREESDEGYDVGESLLPLQPALWPELPSPIFSLTTHNTGLTPPRFHQPSAPMNPPSAADRQGYQAGPESQRFFPNTPEAAPVGMRSTLSVPAPMPVGQQEGGDLPAPSSGEVGGEQTQLSSYGTALGSMELGPVSRPSEHDTGEDHASGSRRSGAVSQQSEDQHVPVTRVALTRISGDVLKLHVVLQEEQRHTIDTQAVSENLSAGDRSTAVSTTAVTSSLPSNQANISAQYSTVPHLQASPANQQASMGRAECPPDALNQYPLLPALLPEDVQVSGNRREIAGLATLLSIIPEGVEPVSPSAQGGSSGESSEGMMWNYIQDQFTLLHVSQDQLLQSLHQQAENRPRLELYTPSTLTTEEEVCRQPPTMILPRFELLQSSLSDSSTLRSTRMTTSSEEYSGSSTFVPHIPESIESSSSPASQCSRDEPDYAFTTANTMCQTSGSVQAGSQRKDGHVHPPATPGYSDEEHISSGDIFGPSRNPGFQEAYQYRKQQQQQESSTQVTSHQSPSAPPSQPATTMSKSMSKKQPNLRLNVVKPAPVTTPKTVGSHVHSREGQTAEPHSNSSHHGDDAFLLHPGVSPLTAPPLFSATNPSTLTPRHSEVRPRSRNESGSSASTPKSSLYDRQEQEWNTLQQQTPGLEDAFLDNPMIGSGSEVSSTHHLSLLYESQGEINTSDQEENDVLSMLQESISNKLGGHRLVFENAEGQFLFDMRVLDMNKGWKELATTFRRKIRDAGFHHFKLMQQDGSPVDYFAPYSPTITRVRVIEVENDRDDTYSICWCDDHLVY